MNYSYYLFKQGLGYRTEQGGHTPITANAMLFLTYLEAYEYRANHFLNDYQIIELI